MSTQSGIKASRELLSSFSQLSHDFLVIKINGTSTELIPDPKSPKSSSSSLDQRFKELKSYITSIHPHPVYIILNLDDEFAFISFIPDIAHIRDKMLYASTKNTLLQELGSSNIKKGYIFSWSELDELTHGHFKSVLPETQTRTSIEDKTQALEEVNDNVGTYSKRLASMDNGLLFKLDDGLVSQLQNAKDKLIIFNIDDKETFKLLSEQSCDVDSIVPTIEQHEGPKFAVYNYHNDDYCLIYSCPSGSKVRDRMIYASNKQSLVSHLKQSLNISKVLEVGDMEELDLHELKPQVKETKVENNLRFSKPKGPRRR
ncbi:twinfilin-1 [[Candida] jaroonii]|uniref:Twinfilin-1 n=1 Tax=[Candida] jaroonii TaxID=467808 RepID=A0ACA9Y1I1_9ASCO|nr:twinfilin-1 [[Candida] jaroonii]